jgi:addiction module RelB/DinJ family antitoxin
MKAVINIKTDKEIKDSAQKLAKEIGLSLSDIINVSLRNFIRTKELYISTNPRMSDQLEDSLSKIEEDIKEGKNLSKGFSSEDEMRNYLKSL